MSEKTVSATPAARKRFSMQRQEYAELVASLQALVEHEVAQVGGYWPVRVAVAVVGEELGYATGYVLGNKILESARCMFNAFWILTCIANQYCCDLSAASSKVWDEGSGDSDAGMATLRAFSHYGGALRIINRYEDGIFTDDQPTESIANVLVRFHYSILSAIHFSGVSISELISGRLETVRSYRLRTDLPAVPRFDPSTNESLARFRVTAARTVCPFARSARVWTTQPWTKHMDVDRYLTIVHPTVLRFSRVCQPEGLDGLVMECFGIADMEDLKEKTRLLLGRLGRLSTINPMAKPLDRRDWRFTLANVDTFVTVFSSIYQANHPRYSHSGGSTFYFFQPQSAFKVKQAKDKLTIRRSFAAAGQDYEEFLKKVRFEAQKFIKPENLLEDDPVEWWRE